MKIAFIGQKGIPAISGGVEKHVEKLSTSLVKHGCEVLVYARANYTPKELKKYQGVEVVNLPSIATKHLDAISHTFLACLNVSFRQKDIDVIHFHAIGPSLLIPLAKILNPKKKVIATFHCQDYYHQKWNWFARFILKLGEKICCHFADEVITVSEVLRRYVKNKYQREAHYLPNGVSVVESLPAKEIKKWDLEENNYIVAVSRLVRHKGIHYLIEAYNNIQTDKKLVIVGDGYHTDNYVEELREKATSNPNIIFVGNQTGEVLSELFSNAYLFVQPSESEGLSIALLEAMSYGKATLVSDIPENIEAIAATGFVFENKNVKSLEDELKYLLNNPEVLSGKGELAKNRVENYYNWEDISKNTIELYKKNEAVIEAVPKIKQA